MAINIFTASGNVGSDMDVRVTPNGKVIGSFSLPVKSGWGENEKVAGYPARCLASERRS